MADRRDHPRHHRRRSVGYGETLPHYTWGQVSDQALEGVRGRNPAELLGDDGLGAGLQMALYDVVGKALEVPAYRLFNLPKVRDWCPIAWWNTKMSPEDLAGEAQDAVAGGYIFHQDTASAGARFQLRWMDCGHNGGLGGSLPGASFLVNCAEGPVSVRAHRLPQPGWHHVAGVYRVDRGAELWIDGELVDEAPSRGTPAEAEVPLTVGHLPGGTARLAGELSDVRVRLGAVPEGWVRTSWENLRDPRGFLRLEG